MIYDDYELLVWYNSDNITTGLRLTPDNSYMNSAYGQYTSSMTMNDVNDLMGYNVVDISYDGYYYSQLWVTNESGYEISLYYQFPDEDYNTPCDFVEVCLN